MVPRIVLFVFIVGILIRFIVAPVAVMIYDASFWAGTLDGLSSGKTIYETEFFYYPPVWGYILSFMSLFLNAFGMSSFGSIFMEMQWSTSELLLGTSLITNLEFNFVFKLPLFLADVLVAVVIFILVKRITSDEKKASIAFSLWFLCPLVIWNSAFQGQFDSIMILMLALSVLMVFEKKYFFAGIFIALGTFTKVFPIIIVPLMIAYILSESQNKEERLKNISYGIIGFLTITAILYIPLIMNGDLYNSFTFLFDRISNVNFGVSTSHPTALTPTRENLVLFIPISFLISILLALRMYKTKINREKTFIILMVMTSCTLIMWPFVSYASQYGLFLIMPLILANSIIEKMKFPLHVVSLLFTFMVVVMMSLQIFYPMPAYMNFGSFELINTSSIPMYGTLIWFMFIPGLYVFITLLRNLLDKKEAIS